MNSETRYRACPLCEAICGLEMRLEDGRLQAIRGDAVDPFSRGHVCPKGNAILDLEADPDRIRTPLRRQGDQWHAIGWEEAFDLAGRRFAELQARHGPASVAAYLGNPTVHHFGHIAYLPALLRLLRTPNVFSASSVDQWPHQLVCSLMYGHQFLLPIPDVDRCDHFLMLGANPMVSNGSLMTVPDVGRRLKALVARGKLVVLDPRRTETADVASEYHAIRPGSDAFFLIAFLQRLLEHGPPRIDAYAGRLSGLDTALAVLSTFDVGDIEARTGVAAATIARLADEFAAAPRAVAYGRMGLSTQRWGSLCQYLLQLANLVTGNLDREGGCLPNEPAIPVTGPGTSPGHRDRWRSRVRGLPEFAGELPVAALAEEILEPGPGQVRGLLTCAGNPVLSTPGGAVLDGAMASLDFHVAIDIYINETTRHADLVLPPASPLTQYHYDLVFNAFAVRRVARLNAPLRPRGPDERADWEIVNGLASAFARASGKAWTELPPPRESIARGLARGDSGLDIDELESAVHGLDLGPLRPSLLRRLETASGRIECAPPLMLSELERLAAVPAPDGLGKGRLQLIGRRDIRSNNSWMHNAPRLVKGKPRHALQMHPRDLAGRGLAEGQRVRVRSEAGSVEVEVQASDRLMPGVASLPHGYGHQRQGLRLARASQLGGASYNDLSDPLALDRASGNAALNGLYVEVEPLG